MESKHRSHPVTGDCNASRVILQTHRLSTAFHLCGGLVREFLAQVHSRRRPGCWTDLKPAFDRVELHFIATDSALQLSWLKNKFSHVQPALKRTNTMFTSTTVVATLNPTVDPVAPSPDTTAPTMGRTASDPIAQLWADLDAFGSQRQAQENTQAMQSRQRFD